MTRKIKTLYTNGCSMTKFELVPEEQQWPNLVRERLGIPSLINDGYGCGSNQRIFRTTYDFVNRKDFDPTETLIIIQMTYAFRFEFLESNGTWAAINQHHSVAENFLFAEKYRKIKTKSFTEEEEKFEYLQKLLAIDNLLKNAGIKNHFFFNYWMPISDKKIIKRLDKTFRWIVESSSAQSHFPEYEHFSDSDPHPSPSGYGTIADWIISNIKHRIV
jgi:hypothetical protein